MTKVRVFFFLLTILIVGAVGVFISFYARGYRFDLKTLKFQPNGILVIQSEPTGASVYIDGELKTATNATLSVAPGTYDVEVKKDGFFSWYKRLTIEKEIVTQETVSLFKNAPSLSPVTFSGAVNPIASRDGTKVAYAVLPGKNVDQDKIGLWVMDTFTLPLGFTNEPKRITDGDLTNSTYIFSPDNRQILLTTSNGVYLLDSGSFTAQSQRVNITSKKESTLKEWATDISLKNAGLIKNLPPELADILQRKSSEVVFSPDENMIAYTASSSGILPDNLIKPLPGASTQNQERNIQSGHTYVYDIKEDRNFLITDQSVSLTPQLTTLNDTQTAPALRWMPSSRHLLEAEDGKVIVMDYDGTNKEIVYSGSYVSPYAFPFSNSTKLLILTNLGGSSSATNLYTLTVK